MPSSSNGRAASQNETRGARSPAGSSHRDRAHLRVVAGSAVRRPASDSDPNLVRDAVAQLSEWQRVMIHRSYYLGRTTTQIAAELNTDDEVVKIGLHQALHALRTTLGSAGDRLVE